MVDIIDEALDILHHTGPEYSGGSLVVTDSVDSLKWG